MSKSGSVTGRQAVEACGKPEAGKPVDPNDNFQEKGNSSELPQES